MSGCVWRSPTLGLRPGQGHICWVCTSDQWGLPGSVPPAGPRRQADGYGRCRSTGPGSRRKEKDSPPTPTTHPTNQTAARLLVDDAGTGSGLNRDRTGYASSRGRGRGVMTRHQALELLLARRIPEDVPSIEATLRAITARMDAVVGSDEYNEVHHRIDELLTARDQVRPEALV